MGRVNLESCKERKTWNAMSTLRAKDKLWNKLLVKNVLQQQLHSHSFLFPIVFQMQLFIVHLYSLFCRFLSERNYAAPHSKNSGTTRKRLLETWRDSLFNKKSFNFQNAQISSFLWDTNVMWFYRANKIGWYQAWRRFTLTYLNLYD